MAKRFVTFYGTQRFIAHPTFIHILSEINAVKTHTPSNFTIYFNKTFHLHVVYFTGCSTQVFRLHSVCNPHPSRACYMPLHLIYLYLITTLKFCWSLQTGEIILFSSAASYSLFPTFKCYPQQPGVRHVNVCPFSRMGGQDPHPSKQLVKLHFFRCYTYVAQFLGLTLTSLSF